MYSRVNYFPSWPTFVLKSHGQAPELEHTRLVEHSGKYVRPGQCLAQKSCTDDKTSVGLVSEYNSIACISWATWVVEGEIIDDITNSFVTCKWGANYSVDLAHWRKFAGFRSIQKEVQQHHGRWRLLCSQYCPVLCHQLQSASLILIILQRPREAALESIMHVIIARSWGLAMVSSNCAGCVCVDVRNLTVDVFEDKSCICLTGANVWAITPTSSCDGKSLFSWMAMKTAASPLQDSTISACAEPRAKSQGEEMACTKKFLCPDKEVSVLV